MNTELGIQEIFRNWKIIHFDWKRLGFSNVRKVVWVQQTESFGKQGEHLDFTLAMMGAIVDYLSFFFFGPQREEQKTTHILV